MLRLAKHSQHLLPVAAAGDGLISISAAFDGGNVEVVDWAANARGPGSHRTPWYPWRTLGFSPYWKNAIGNAPALVPRPYWLDCKTYADLRLLSEISPQVVDASDPTDIQLRFRADVATPKEGNRAFYQWFC
jgi:hypothetical protein